MEKKSPEHCKHRHLLTGDNVLPMFKGAQGVRCRSCFNARRRKHYAKNHSKIRKAANTWRKNNPDKVRKWKLKHEYALSPEDYEQILSAQGYCCAICSRSFLDEKNKPVIDHDHQSEEVRGILCSSCNVGLGFLGDTLPNIEAACKYLSKGKV